MLICRFQILILADSSSKISLSINQTTKERFRAGHTCFIALLAFPFHQALPQCMMFLHRILFSMYSLAPTFPISSFTTSRNLFFFLPFFLFPGNSISIALLPTYSWSLLMTCPYHLSLPSLIFIPNRSTLTVLLMCSFLIFSGHSHSKPQHFHFCNFNLFYLFLCDRHRLKSIHHCWSHYCTVHFSFYPSW